MRHKVALPRQPFVVVALLWGRGEHGFVGRCDIRCGQVIPESVGGLLVSTGIPIL